MTRGPTRRDALLTCVDARVVKFLMVGALNTLFGYVMFLSALWLTGRPIISLAISSILGVLFNFCTTAKLVFGSSDLRLLARFIGVYAFVFIVNAGLLETLQRIGLAPAFAALILTPFMAALSYVLLRDHVFSRIGVKTM